MPNNSSRILEIEQTLARGTCASHTKEHVAGIESNLKRIRQTFDILPALSSLLDEDPGVPSDTPTSPAPESGSSSTLGDFLQVTDFILNL